MSVSRAKAMGVAFGVGGAAGILAIALIWPAWPAARDWLSRRAAGGDSPYVTAVVHRAGIMGTECNVTAVADRGGERQAAAAVQAAQQALLAVEARMSPTLEASELSQLNAARAGQAVALSPATMEVLGLSRQMHRATGGAFDVTCMPLFNLWAQAGRWRSLPTQAELDAARAACGWEKIELLEAGARKKLDAAGVGLGGIAKGYGIDRAAEAMRASGCRGGLVDVGGDIRCFGPSPRGGKWRVAIRNPFDPAGEDYLGTLEVADAAVCTSGNYFRYAEIDGRRYSHIIDPKTGRPVDSAPSVTVVAATTAVADAWATALSVLGEEGLTLLEADGAGGIEAMIVVGTPDDHRFCMTPGFVRLLAEPLRAPPGGPATEPAAVAPAAQARARPASRQAAPASRPSAPGNPTPRQEPAMREITIEKRYLHLPVNSGQHLPAEKCRMKVSVGPTLIDEFDIELADGEPDFWVFLDLGGFRGQTAKIEAAGLPEGHAGLAAIRQADEVPGADVLYKEKHRPQFHFTSRRGWNNDCNGLVCYKGEYHLYYQHNPYGWKWGNMHWGHAVSKDLVHWEELPIAIYPRRYGDWVYSGSAAVDWLNTTGFRTGQEDVIVAAYTSTGRGECIAYSNDRGRTFTEYQGNPVVRHNGRDPRIFWHEASKHWVMAVYDERDGGKSRGIAFYTSADMKKWDFASRIDGYYECPELFELAVDGDRMKSRWVVYAADGDYAVGRFDGREFRTESGKHRFSHGNCFYASQTWSDVPAADGRRIQIAWGKISTPGMPFNQCMLFPVELTLRTTEEGIRLFAEPVREIERLHGRRHAWRDLELTEGAENPLKGIAGEFFHIRAEMRPQEAAEVGLTVRGTPVAYDVRKQELTCRGCRAPLKPADGAIRLEVLVDRTSIEVYANGGRVYMPVGIIHPADDRTLGVFARGGRAGLTAMEVYELKSAWQ